MSMSDHVNSKLERILVQLHTLLTQVVLCLQCLQPNMVRSTGCYFWPSCERNSCWTSQARKSKIHLKFFLWDTTDVFHLIIYAILFINFTSDFSLERCYCSTL